MKVFSVFLGQVVPFFGGQKSLKSRYSWDLISGTTRTTLYIAAQIIFLFKNKNTLTHVSFLLFGVFRNFTRRTPCY